MSMLHIQDRLKQTIYAFSTFPSNSQLPMTRVALGHEPRNATIWPKYVAGFRER